MQLKKRQWKMVRDRVPCVLCADEAHAGRECNRRSRNGKRKRVPAHALEWWKVGA